MSDVIVWILGIATLLGGIAAVFYFVERRRERQRWNEKEREVNSAWWESSEVKKQYEARGFKDFAWSNSDRVASRLQDGMEIVYEIDEKNRTTYKLINKSGQVLLCRSGV